VLYTIQNEATYVVRFVNTRTGGPPHRHGPPSVYAQLVLLLTSSPLNDVSHFGLGLEFVNSSVICSTRRIGLQVSLMLSIIS